MYPFFSENEDDIILNFTDNIFGNKKKKIRNCNFLLDSQSSYFSFSSNNLISDENSDSLGNSENPLGEVSFNQFPKQIGKKEPTTEEKNSNKITKPKTQANEFDFNKEIENDEFISMNNGSNISIFIDDIYKKTTDFKELNKNNEKKNKIFDIKKIKKKGRLPKEAKYFKGKHDKFASDNIIRKIKAQFYIRIVEYINYEYEQCFKKTYPGKNNTKKFIQKINASESKIIKKNDNLNWFSLKIKDILSADISPKYKKYNSDYNKKQIEKIYKKNELKDLIEILEKSVRDIYNKYISNTNEANDEGFKNLEYDINLLRKEMEENEEKNINDYIKKYKEFALNLEEKFKKKRDRKE